MHPNAKLLEEFYAAFNRKDGPAMVAAYADDVEFSDPVFPGLKGVEAKGMWTMLCGSAKDLTVEASQISADDTQGRAHWEAHYTFSVTGRRVHNIIDATFRFKDGRIVEHRDSFDFWRWSRLALGLPGVLLGWTPLVRNKVRGTARASLDRYLAAEKR